MARKILVSGLALAPLAAILRWVVEAGDVTVFCFSALALVPLAWLIGEATENVAEHTGPGIGGFLNASFGNAPELIIAFFAVGSNLPNVVRGSIAGSVVSTVLLVLGAAIVAGGDAPSDRRSIMLQAATVLAAVLLFLASVIVAIVGNAAEHGGAVVTARRGNPRLGSEIAISSATQVAVFVAPVIALLSFLVGHDLPLAFRPVELAAMGGAAICAGI